MRRIRALLTGLSGARTEVLDQCPSERVKFESLGWAILITSGMAMVSMWFALSSAMGINGILAVIPAITWGLVIMGIDRWLITSMPLEGGRRLAIAVPRLLLALLLGTLISTPFVLRIFESEINAQVAVIKEVRAANFLVQQQNSSVGKAVTTAQTNVNNLKKVIQSQGAVPLNPAADPDVQSLTKQRNAELTLENQYYKQWQCQLYGGPGCPAGNGQLAQASHNSYLQAKQQVSQLNNEIQQRESSLAATDKASQQARLSEAEEQLPKAEAQLALAQANENALLQNFNSTNENTNGLLIRLQALDQLSSNSTVSVARFLVFLLFLVIECLPVTVKLMQKPGVYEQILKAEREQELLEARKRYRVRRGGGASVAGGSQLRLGAGAGRPAAGTGRATSLHDIWQGTPEPSYTTTMPDSEKPDAARQGGGSGYNKLGYSDDQVPTTETVAPGGGYQQYPGRSGQFTSNYAAERSGEARPDSMAGASYLLPPTHLDGASLGDQAAYADETRPEPPTRQVHSQPESSGLADSGGLTAVHQKLRNMGGAQANGKSGPDTGGIPLNFDDDDL